MTEENIDSYLDTEELKQNVHIISSQKETPFELETLKDELISVDWSKIKMPSKTDLKDLLMKRILSNIRPDCCVVIGDDVFYCHLMVLKCYSKYFDATEGNKFNFKPRQVSASAFSFIYNWMIGSEPDIYNYLSKQNILEIFLASHILGIEDLEKQCETFIECEEMNTEEASIVMYLKASQLGDKFITNAFQRNVLIYFYSLVSSQNFLRISPGDLCDILKSDYITVHGEFEIFMSAVRWLMHDWKKRKQILVNIMQCIRFGHIAAWQLVDILRNPQNPEFLLISSNLKVQKMIEEGIRYATVKQRYGDKPQDLCSIFHLESPSPRNWIDMGKNYKLYQHFLADLELHRRLHRKQLSEPTFAKTFCIMNELVLLRSEMSVYHQGSQQSCSYSSNSASIMPTAEDDIKTQSSTKSQSHSSNSAIIMPTGKDEIQAQTSTKSQSHSSNSSSIMLTSKCEIEAQASIKSQTSSSEEFVNPSPPTTSHLFERPQRITFFDGIHPARHHSATLEPESAKRISIEGRTQSKEDKIEKVGSFSFDLNVSSHSIKEDQPLRDEIVKSFDVYFLPEVGGSFRKWSQVVAEGDAIQRNYLAEGSLFYKKRDAVLIFGGIDQNEITERKSIIGKDIYRYHPEGNFWEVVGELPEPRHHHRVALLKGYVFVVGGADPRKDSIRTHSTVVGTVWSFDPITRCWCSENGLITPRKNFGLVVSNGKLYAIGGQDRNEIPLSSVEKFDPSSGIWEEVAPMNKGRAGLAATKYKDLIWVAGGMTGLKTSNNRRVTGSVECYDPKLNIWIPGKLLQFPMCFGKLFAKYDTLYVIGGAGRKSERDQNTASIGTIHAWNEEKEEWTLRTELAIPRHNHSVSYLASQMLIIGGVTTVYMKALRNIECYCCDRRTWIRGIAELPINVSGHDSLTLPAATVMNAR